MRLIVRPPRPCPRDGAHAPVIGWNDIGSSHGPIIFSGNRKLLGPFLHLFVESWRRKPIQRLSRASAVWLADQTPGVSTCQYGRSGEVRSCRRWDVCVTAEVKFLKVFLKMKLFALFYFEWGLLCFCMSDCSACVYFVCTEWLQDYIVSSVQCWGRTYNGIKLI